jgi:hypothetical protein
MIRHYGDTDESYIIGIFASIREAEDILRIFTDRTGIQMFECHSDIFLDSGDFHRDTIVIQRHQFEEDLLDLLNYEISVYVTDGGH